MHSPCKEHGKSFALRHRASLLILLRGIATLLLVSLHLEMAQNGSTNNALEGGSLFRISMCYRCVIIMTVLTLHLALGGEKKEGTSAKSTSASFQSVFKSCNLKLARKFLRHLPLMMLSVWWDHIGTRLAFPSQPIKYVDGTQSTVEGSLLKWTFKHECLASYWTCVFRLASVNWQVRDANERVLFLLWCFASSSYRSLSHHELANVRDRGWDSTDSRKCNLSCIRSSTITSTFICGSAGWMFQPS